jgi:hypothetical protein
MSKLEQALTPHIPFEAAAPFLVRLKTAGWTDPPDVTGALEGVFTVPREVVLDKLKSVIATKARLMLAWYTYAQSFKGDAWRSIKSEFEEHAEAEQEGFSFYAKRAAALGGPIHMDPVEPPPPASDPQAIFSIMARAEQEGILAQRELRDLVGDQNPMKIGIEEQLAKDQHHLDEMWQLMPQGAQPLATASPDASLSPAAGLADPAAAPPVAPEAALPEEGGPSPAAEEEPSAPDVKEASLRFTRALHALRKEAGVATSAGKSVLQDALQGVTPAANPLKRYGQLLTGSRVKPLQEAAHSARGQTLRDSASVAQQAARPPETAAQASRILGRASGLQDARAEAGNLQHLANEERARVGLTRGITAGVPLGTAAALLTPRDQGRTKRASEKDDALRATGRDRAVTNLAAEAHREAGRRGERAGAVLGGVGGAVGGAALGKHLKAPMGAGRTIGAGLGYLAGRSAGKEVGTEVDIHRNKSKTAAMYGFDGEDRPSREEAVQQRIDRVTAQDSNYQKTRLQGALEGMSSGSVLGGLAGAGLGALVAPKGNRTLGTGVGLLSGMAAGAPLGAAVGAVKKAGVADVAPAFGGLSAGYGMGGNAAEATARAVAPQQHDEAAGTTARRMAMLAAPAAGVGAMVAAHKLKAVPRALGALNRLSPLGTIAEPAIEQEIARLAVPAGAALGGSVLGGALAGGAVGATKHKEAADAFARGLRKLAFGEPQPNGGQAQQAMMPPPVPQPPPEVAPAAVGYDQPAPEPQPGAAALESSPFEGMNYLGAEQAGRAAQEQNESAYYRQKFQEAAQQLEMVQGDATAAQASAEQLQQQHALVNQDVSSATNEALEANVEATRQAQAAANLRIGLEKMRQQLMGIVSQDPELLAQTPTMDPALGDPGLEAPPEEGGPAGEAPSPGQAPGAAPPGPGAPGETGAEPQNASGTPGTVVNIGSQPNEKRAGLKEHLRTAAPWAAGGALVGGIAGGIPQHARAQSLRDRVKTMESARQPGDYAKAKALSKDYADLHDAERVNASPLRGALSGALLGGATMAGVGPEVMKHIKDIRTYAH